MLTIETSLYYIGETYLLRPGCSVVTYLSMATSSGPLTSGKVSSDDHGPLIIITAGIMIATTLLTLTLRLHQRWPWPRLPKLEDATLVLGTVGACSRLS